MEAEKRTDARQDSYRVERAENRSEQEQNRERQRTLFIDSLPYDHCGIRVRANFAATIDVLPGSHFDRRQRRARSSTLGDVDPPGASTASCYTQPAKERDGANARCELRLSSAADVQWLAKIMSALLLALRLFSSFASGAITIRRRHQCPRWLLS